MVLVTASFLVIIWFQLAITVWSHARLMSPPSRSSMWRLGFPTKTNFNDNALYCGGIQVQWNKNKGRCGICGDPYDMPHPRDNEAGGKYGKGIISRRYISGQIMVATVDVTTNHKGYFEFKLCPNNNPKKEATQECLDKHVLKQPYGGSKFYISDRGNGNITAPLQLPKGLTCSQCVFQWTYVAGNNWGRCEDGKSRLGCGPQETFRGCADIEIQKSFDFASYKPNKNDVMLQSHYVHNSKNKEKAFKTILNNKFPKYPEFSTSSQSTEDQSSSGENSENSNLLNKDEIHKSLWKLLNYYSDDILDSDTSPYFNNNNFLRSVSLNDFDVKNGYYVIPTQSSVSSTLQPDKDAKLPHKTFSDPTLPSSNPKKISRKDMPQITTQFVFPFSQNISKIENGEKSSRGFYLGGKFYKDFWFL